MIIIIDGYNLLHIGKSLQPHLDTKGFISQIAKYRKIKSHQITIVFDGGNSSYETEEFVHGLSIIYSGYAQNADMVIIALLKNNFSHKDVLVVSSDHEIRDEAAHLNIPSIDSELFYSIILQRLAATKGKKVIQKYHAPIHKITAEENQFIDSLMTSGGNHDKDHEISDDLINLPQKNQYSKQEKTLFHILQKL